MPGWPLFFAVLFISCSADDTPICRDADGSPVDWYFIYKLPRSSKALSPLQKQGVAYAYITSSAPEDGWTISTVGIDDLNSIPAKTLAPIYDKMTPNSSLRVLYNNEPPSGDEVSAKPKDHTKGVLVASNTTGFWLVHNVPKFPPAARIGYQYPPTAERNGQSFLCISVPFGEVDKIGLQFRYNQISAYDSFIPLKMANSVKNVIAAVNDRGVPLGKEYNIASINSALTSTVFTSYAKTEKFGKDLYADLVAKEENVPLVVQSWRKGSGQKLPSDCQTPGQEISDSNVISRNGLRYYCDARSEEKNLWGFRKHPDNSVPIQEKEKNRSGKDRYYHVPTGFRKTFLLQLSQKPTYNLKTTKLWLRSIEPQLVTEFNTGSDHSKWAVSWNSRTGRGPDKKVVCVGDINRMEPQKERGGGTVCLSHPGLWNTYFRSVESYEYCPEPK